MGDAAMVGEAVNRPVQVPEHVEVGSFRRQHQGDGGQRRFAIQAGAAEAGPCQEVSERLQSLAETIRIPHRPLVARWPAQGRELSQWTDAVGSATSVRWAPRSSL